MTRSKLRARVKQPEDHQAIFCFQKLKWACLIMAVGLAIAFAWDGWHGWILKSGYPKNTFLLAPELRFSDYENAIHIADDACPYDPAVEDGYFPSIFSLYRFIGLFPGGPGFFIFLWIHLAATLTLLSYALYPLMQRLIKPTMKMKVMEPREIATRRKFRGLVLISLASYPLWMTVDRTNDVVTMILFLSWLHLSTLLIGWSYALYPFIKWMGRISPRMAVQNTRKIAEMRSLRYTAFLVLISYPMWFAIDRANSDITMFILVAAAVYFYNKSHYALGTLFLLPAICFKAYPAVMLALLLRRRKLRWIFVCVAGFFIINWLSVLTFSHSVVENIGLWKRGMHLTHDNFIIENHGIVGTATPWNGIKVIIGAVHYLWSGDSQSVAAFWRGLRPTLEIALTAFNALCVLGALVVTFYTVFVEKEFLRRAVLLLLFMTMAGPYGMDYKLLHAETAMIALIFLTTRRPNDLIIVVLLALAFIPKREILIPYLGVSATRYEDTAIGILINPPLMLAAMALLMIDGWRQWDPKWAAARLKSILPPGYRPT